MMWDLLIKNGTVVNSWGRMKADVAVSDGKIAAVGDLQDMQAKKVIDARGKYVLPGMIDSHAHIQTGVGERKSGDTYYTGSIAAAYGGTTSFVDFAFLNEGETPKTAMERKMKEAAGESVLDYSFHPCITSMDPRSLDEIHGFLQSGFPSIKLFTVYRGTLMLEKAGVYEVMKMIAREGGLAQVHAESADMIERNIADAIREGRTDARAHALSRPPVTELEAMYGVYAMARETGAPVILAHMTTGKAMELFRHAEKGLLFGEVCPHYLVLDDSVYDRPDGYNYICSPPIRGRRDREALWDMVEKGYVQLVNSDHTDYSKAQKERHKDYFPDVPNGLPTIETRGMVFFSEGVVKRGISLERFVDLTSANAAKLMGLYPRKGVIRPGSDGDLVVIDPNVHYHMEAAAMHMATDFCPYEGMEMTGAVDCTIAGGAVIIENRKFTGTDRKGKLMERSKPLIP